MSGTDACTLPFAPSPLSTPGLANLMRKGYPASAVPAPKSVARIEGAGWDLG